MNLNLTKMQGTGNDYIFANLLDVVDSEIFDEMNRSQMAIRLSDRHFGIGSDGLIFISPSDIADCRMRMFNADGSEGKMCGNGIRCVAKYVYDNGMTDKEVITVETLSGIKTLQLAVSQGRVQAVTVDMGSPVLTPSQIPVKCEGDRIINQPVSVGGKEYYITCVSMGNPHAVVFTEEEVTALNLEKTGPLFENHEIFPDRVNTEFIHVIDEKTIDMRVWERGSGETLACGTGACASVVACVLNHKTEDEVLVHLLGGDLEVRYDREKNTVLLTGPAEFICTGEIAIYRRD